MVQICSTCGETKDETEFYVDHRKKNGGRERQCKACRKARNRQWVEANRETVRRINQRSVQRRSPETRLKARVKSRMKKLGSSWEHYVVLREAQDNRCAICGKQAVENHSLDVDHDHRTGKVRALLCNACNQALGLMKDNPQRLRKAAAYLEYHS